MCDMYGPVKQILIMSPFLYHSVYFAGKYFLEPNILVMPYLFECAPKETDHCSL